MASQSDAAINGLLQRGFEGLMGPSAADQAAQDAALKKVTEKSRAAQLKERARQNYPYDNEFERQGANIGAAKSVDQFLQGFPGGSSFGKEFKAPPTRNSFLPTLNNDIPLGGGQMDSLGLYEMGGPPEDAALSAGRPTATPGGISKGIAKGSSARTPSVDSGGMDFTPQAGKNQDFNFYPFAPENLSKGRDGKTIRTTGGPKGPGTSQQAKPNVSFGGVDDPSRSVATDLTPEREDSTTVGGSPAPISSDMAVLQKLAGMQGVVDNPYDPRSVAAAQSAASKLNAVPDTSAARGISADGAPIPSDAMTYFNAEQSGQEAAHNDLVSKAIGFGMIKPGTRVQPGSKLAEHLADLVNHHEAVTAIDQWAKANSYGNLFPGSHNSARGGLQGVEGHAMDYAKQRSDFLNPPVPPSQEHGSRSPVPDRNTPLGGGGTSAPPSAGKSSGPANHPYVAAPVSAKGGGGLGKAVAKSKGLERGTPPVSVSRPGVKEASGAPARGQAAHTHKGQQIEGNPAATSRYISPGEQRDPGQGPQTYFKAAAQGVGDAISGAGQMIAHPSDTMHNTVDYLHQKANSYSQDPSNIMRDINSISPEQAAGGTAAALTPMAPKILKGVRAAGVTAARPKLHMYPNLIMDPPPVHAADPVKTNIRPSAAPKATPPSEAVKPKAGGVHAADPVKVNVRPVPKEKAKLMKDLLGKPSRLSAPAKKK